MEADKFPYRDGKWIWDVTGKCLAFKPRIPPPSILAKSTTGVPRSPNASPTQIGMNPETIVFREALDSMEKMKFKRYHIRRAAVTDPDEVVTLQDCKDVVIYLANPYSFTATFIRYFHSKEVDKFLRALIVYFQLFTETWDKMLVAREESKRKLRHPKVKEKEDKIRRDLIDLRGVLTREYASILMGYQALKRYHHLRPKYGFSATEKDRFTSELLLKMSTRVVWVALYKKNLNLIEHEMNRLFRSPHFNRVEHASKAGKSPTVTRSPREIEILFGKSNRMESKIMQRSPLINELISENYDYRTMGVNQHRYEPSSERLKYLEIAYGAAERKLVEHKVPVGILGLSRKFFEIMLSFKEKSRLAAGKPNISFSLPPEEPCRVDTDKAAFVMMPTSKPKWKYTWRQNDDRVTQRNQWMSLLGRRRSSSMKRVSIALSDIEVGPLDDSVSAVDA